MSSSCKIDDKPKNAAEFFKSHHFWKPFIGTILGGLAGFLYYYYVGCSSGSCAITSNPYMSVVFGAGFGFLISKGGACGCK